MSNSGFTDNEDRGDRLNGEEATYRIYGRMGSTIFKYEDSRGYIAHHPDLSLPTISVSLYGLRRISKCER